MGLLEFFKAMVHQFPRIHPKHGDERQTRSGKDIPLASDKKYDFRVDQKSRLGFDSQQLSHANKHFKGWSSRDHLEGRKFHHERSDHYEKVLKKLPKKHFKKDGYELIPQSHEAVSLHQARKYHVLAGNLHDGVGYAIHVLGQKPKNLNKADRFKDVDKYKAAHKKLADPYIAYMNKWKDHKESSAPNPPGYDKDRSHMTKLAGQMDTLREKHLIKKSARFIFKADILKFPNLHPVKKDRMKLESGKTLPAISHPAYRGKKGSHFSGWDAADHRDARDAHYAQRDHYHDMMRSLGDKHISNEGAVPQPTSMMAKKYHQAGEAHDNAASYHWGMASRIADKGMKKQRSLKKGSEPGPQNMSKLYEDQESHNDDAYHAEGGKLKRITAPQDKKAYQKAKKKDLKEDIEAMSKAMDDPRQRQMHNQLLHGQSPHFQQYRHHATQFHMHQNAATHWSKLSVRAKEADHPKAAAVENTAREHIKISREHRKEMNSIMNKHGMKLSTPTHNKVLIGIKSTVKDTRAPKANYIDFSPEKIKKARVDEKMDPQDRAMARQARQPRYLRSSSSQGRMRVEGKPEENEASIARQKRALPKMMGAQRLKFLMKKQPLVKKSLYAYKFKRTTQHDVFNNI